MFWTILISLAIQLLPKIIEWLKTLFADGKQLTAAQAEKVNRIIWYGNQIREVGGKVGASAEGTPPPMAASPLPMEGFLVDWIVNYVLDQGPAIALPILQKGVVPFLEQKAKDTANKWDDYGAKKFKEIVHDPEFIALIEGIG